MTRIELSQTSQSVLEEITRPVTGVDALLSTEVLQSLWSGYGEIVRCTYHCAQTQEPKSVIVKHVRWPTESHHPRGWNTGQSHQRKVQSYQVESAWYEQWAPRCDSTCRVPVCLAVEAHGDEVFIVMEDLDASGFAGRRSTLSTSELAACLTWLANFHAKFLGEVPAGLWPVGTYWHLATRPDELERLADPALQAAASVIDEKLSSSPFQTLVHGDAKVANFCFANDGRVAAVDFQYVGGGCGMKDVIYFISSCLAEEDCERREGELLDYYFQALRAGLRHHGKTVNVADLEANWRELYPVAWTDFFRFLQGWSPDHWKINRYSRRLARDVLATL